MLENYCNSLSDEAQLNIALRLGKLALPVWKDFLSKHTDKIKNINNLIDTLNRAQGVAQEIDVNFPSRALEKIERSFEKAKKNSHTPIPVMKSDGTLSPLLATSMQPLCNSKWDDTLPYTVRLTFTMVWNILSWILFRRKTHTNETHIYIAINQAADVLMTEKILSVAEIENILSEYKNETRVHDEDLLWEKAPGVKKPKGLNQDEIYKKIIGENIIKDPAGNDLAEEILRQMRDEGKTFWDQWEEYYSGTCKIYSFNKQVKSFWYSEADVIAASFSNEYAMSEQEMFKFISSVSLHDLRESGFEI